MATVLPISGAEKPGNVHEYLLQGSILDAHVEHLVQRLKGLCDNVDSGPEMFNDHEICFSLRDPKQPGNLQFRVRKALDVDVPYQLRYIGQPEMGDRNRPTLVRSSIDIRCTRSIVEFLTELGCRVEFEFLNRGWIFRRSLHQLQHEQLLNASLSYRQRTHEDHRLKDHQGWPHSKRGDLTELPSGALDTCTQWTGLDCRGD